MRGMTVSCYCVFVGFCGDVAKGSREQKVLFSGSMLVKLLVMQRRDVVVESVSEELFMAGKGKDSPVCGPAIG